MGKHNLRKKSPQSKIKLNRNPFRNQKHKKKEHNRNLNDISETPINVDISSQESQNDNKSPKKVKKQLCVISLIIDLIILLGPIVYNIKNGNYIIGMFSDEFSSFPHRNIHINGTMINITIPYDIQFKEGINILLIISDSIIAIFSIINYIAIIIQCKRNGDIIKVYCFFSFLYILYECFRYSYACKYFLKEYTIINKKEIVNCRFFNFSDGVYGFIMAFCIFLKMNESFYLCLTEVV